jgi:hypothetical protein
MNQMNPFARFSFGRLLKKAANEAAANHHSKGWLG